MGGLELGAVDRYVVRGVSPLRLRAVTGAAPRLKVCCIASVDEMRAAVAAGASAVGLVSEMPSGPGVIPEPLIAEIAAATPPGVDTFLLTCRQDVDAIAAQQRR